jgi:hypothetical protein
MNTSVTDTQVINATKLWLDNIIIALNFCPFAKKEFVNNTIHYQVCHDIKMAPALENLILACEHLTQHNHIETSLLIFDKGFVNFDNYLDLVDMANQLIVDSGYEGVYQVASFHPHYCFEGEDPQDAANYTNRSPYPMLHLIREDSLEKVLALHPDPESIPHANIELARNKGSDFFKAQLLAFKASAKKA